MATEVSSLARILNDYYSSKKLDDHNKSMKEIGKSTTCLITRDFLGGSKSTDYDDDDSQELDLDLQVPNGWEKRLDLKSGKVYIQRSDSPNSLSSSNNPTNKKIAKLQDFNFSPSSLLSSSTKLSLNLFDKTSLDLKLVTAQSPCSYQSVCTLDKVKFALDRANRDNLSKKRSSLSCSSSSPSNSSSSIKENEENEKKSLVSQNGQLFAAGCPNCLLYVMISKNNPGCPRCNSNVPLPMFKKPKIDLNISM